MRDELAPGGCMRLLVLAAIAWVLIAIIAIIIGRVI